MQVALVAKTWCEAIAKRAEPDSSVALAKLFARPTSVKTVPPAMNGMSSGARLAPVLRSVHAGYALFVTHPPSRYVTTVSRRPAQSRSIVSPVVCPAAVVEAMFALVADPTCRQAVPFAIHFADSVGSMLARYALSARRRLRGLRRHTKACARTAQLPLLPWCVSIASAVTTATTLLT